MKEVEIYLSLWKQLLKSEGLIIKVYPSSYELSDKKSKYKLEVKTVTPTFIIINQQIEKSYSLTYGGVKIEIKKEDSVYSEATVLYENMIAIKEQDIMNEMIEELKLRNNE